MKEKMPARKPRNVKTKKGKHDGLATAKRLAENARKRAGLSFAAVGVEIQCDKRSAFRRFSDEDQRYHLRYGDMLAMASSKKAESRIFVAVLINHLAGLIVEAV